MKVAVIIPSYHPGDEFPELLHRLEQQTIRPTRILVKNTDPSGWNREWETKFPFLEVEHLSAEEFDHGGTRRKAAAECTEDYLIFLTQDALPADQYLLEELLASFREEGVGAAFGRQLPRKDCKELERITRNFNYPEESYVRRLEDVQTYGIKTYFCSNVCAAYKREIYEEVGGFPERTIFNEDMIYAGRMVRKGYKIAYASKARVFHSHNYNGVQQLRRNFDLGVSQAQFPDVFENVPSEREGIRMVSHTVRLLMKKRQGYRLPSFFYISGMKFLGYRLGKRYNRLPISVIRKISMNPMYWKNGKQA